MAPLEAVFFWATLALYAVTTGVLVYSLAFGKPRALALGGFILAVAFVLHTGAIAARYAAQGHLPWSGDYENGLTGGWFVVAFTLWTMWRNRSLRAMGAATVPLTLLMMGFGAMRNPTLSPLAASLKSSWLVIHVFFAWLAFGAYALAMGAGVLYLHRSKQERGAAAIAAPDRLPLERLEELTFRYIVFGFITDAVMIASGAIWARDLWGSYWSWDPVETWSLVTWLGYGVVLHLRLTRGWRGPRLAWLASLAIVGMIISFFGVTFVVDTSNHFFNVR